MKFNVKIPVRDTYSYPDVVKRYGREIVDKLDSMAPKIGYVCALDNTMIEFFTLLRISETRLLGAYYYRNRELFMDLANENEIIVDYSDCLWTPDHYRVIETVCYINGGEL